MSCVLTRNLNSHLVLPLLLVAVLGLTPAYAQEPSSTTPPAERPDADIPTAPVEVDGTTLFSLRGMSGYPAEKRAQKVSDRIVQVAANRAIPKQSLRLIETPDTTEILAGDHKILTIVDADASLEGVARQVLAGIFMSRIGDAIDGFRHDREPAFLARQALYALAATLIFLLTLILGRLAVRRLHSTLETRYRGRIPGIRIQSFYLLRPEQLWGILTKVARLFWAGVVLLAAYLYLDYVLSLFPWTRGLARNLIFLLVNPLQTMGMNLVRIVPDLVFLVILALVTRYVLVLIRLLFDAIESRAITLKEFDPDWSKPTYRLVRVGVIVFALVVAYPYIPGSSSQAFQGVSLFIGVLFSLGSTSLIANIVAGYTMTYRRTFKTGDRVRIGDHLGNVEQASLIATYLRTPKNELVVVPNSKVINEEVMNYSTLAAETGKGLILHTNVTVGYNAPWRQVEAMLLEAAARSPGILREPKPFVLQKMLGVFTITYELNAYCNQPSLMLRLYTQLHQNILDVFNEYGVQIMTPTYESDPEQVKVVPRDRWYAAPAPPPNGEGLRDSEDTVEHDDTPPKRQAS